MTLLLSKGDTGDGVVEEIRGLIGPPDVEKAKEEAPERYIKSRLVTIHTCLIRIYCENSE